MIEIKISDVKCNDETVVDVYFSCEMLSDNSGYSLIAMYTKEPFTHEKAINKLIIPKECNGIPITHISKMILSCNNPCYKEDRTRYCVGDKCKVKELELSDNIVSVEPMAFAVLYADVIRWSSSCREIEEETFEMSKITKITNIDNVTSIKASAFKGCRNLTSFDWPEMCFEVPKECFFNCFNLKEIRITEKCNKIGEEAFAHCESLERFYWPTACLEIPNSCFSDCHKLSKIENISLVESIADKAFCGAGIEVFSIGDKCREVGKSCFEKCAKLKKVKWNKQIKKIPNDCFYNCSSLTVVEGIEEVNEMGIRVFCESGIEVFEWPKDCNVVSYACFDKSNLREITLPRSIEKIENFAFCNTPLKKVNLSHTLLTHIGKPCFPESTIVTLPLYL